MTISFKQGDNQTVCSGRQSPVEVHGHCLNLIEEANWQLGDANEMPLIN